MSVIQKVFITVISFYQRTLSPDHGWFRARYPHGFCRYYPSCSEYARQAIARHGVARGVLIGIARIVRCNPWATPAVDPVSQH